jgi:hypothetical protein
MGGYDIPACKSGVRRRAGGRLAIRERYSIFPAQSTLGRKRSIITALARYRNLSPTDSPQNQFSKFLFEEAVFFTVRKIAVIALYHIAMITFIFTLTLAVRWVAQVVGAVAADEKSTGDWWAQSRLALPSRFPNNSLPDPVAGEIFSLPTGSRKLTQQLDHTRISPSEGGRFRG